MDEHSEAERVPRLVWRLLKLPVRAVYALGLGFLPGQFVLLLTTIGRKSGLARVTPLQYDEVNGNFYVGSARGVRADWYRNILANPKVEVMVRWRRFCGLAHPITDPGHIADLIEVRLKRRPGMMAAIFRAQGLPARPNRVQLEAYAAKRAMIVIRPVDDVLTRPASQAPSGQGKGVENAKSNAFCILRTFADPDSGLAHNALVGRVRCAAPHVARPAVTFLGFAV